jgi:hypothetical protein
LINNALRVVAEITKLRFPHDQAVGVHQTVAEFKTERAEFRQGAIAHGKVGLFVGQVVQRDVQAFIFLVVQNGVAMTKCTALNILKSASARYNKNTNLTTQANMGALHQERAKSHGFGRGPVNVLPVVNRLSAILHDSSKHRVYVKVGRITARHVSNMLENLERGTSLVDRHDLLGELFGAFESWCVNNPNGLPYRASWTKPTRP